MNTKIITLAACLFMLIQSVMAQHKVEVELVEKKISEGKHTAFSVLIPEANDMDMVQKQWKTFVNKSSIIEYIDAHSNIEFLNISNKSKKERKALVKHLGKVESRGSELVLKNLLYEESSGAHLDVISLMEKADSGIVFNSFFKYGDNQFVDKKGLDKGIEKALNAFTRAFGVRTYQAVVKEQLNAEEKKLKECEKALSNLEKENRNLHKSIEKSEAEINTLTAEMEPLHTNAGLIAEGLTTIAEALAGMTESSFDYEHTKKSEKEKLKEQKKNNKMIESCKNKINKNEQNISSAKTGIEENLEAQSTQKQVVADQEAVVEQFKNKLKNIK